MCPCAPALSRGTAQSGAPAGRARLGRRRQELRAVATGWSARLLMGRPSPFAAPGWGARPIPLSRSPALAFGADGGPRAQIRGHNSSRVASLFGPPGHSDRCCSGTVAGLPEGGLAGATVPLLLGLGMAAAPLARLAHRRPGGASAHAPTQLDPDDALQRTLGSGLYQLCVFVFVGMGFYSFAFPFQILAVFTDGKMAADPGLPAFTKHALSYASSVQYFGWLVGAVIIGPLTDHWGRQPVVFGGMIGLLISSVVAVVVPSQAASSLFTFVAAKFAMGMFCAVGASAGVLMQECIPGKLRGRAMAAVNTVYSLTAAIQAFLSGTATLTMDWRVETLLWYTPALTGVLCGLPLVGESLRFLVARGRAREAQALLARIAKTNGVAASAEGVTVVAPEVLTPPPAADQGGKEKLLAIENARAASESLLSPELLPRVCAMAVCWATAAMTNYGLQYSAGELSPDLYTNSMMLNLVDLFGYIIVLGVDFLGRRATQSACFLVAGLGLLLCGALTPGTWPMVACALVGRLFINACFTTVYIMVVELFPTGCRSAALGVCTVAARIGGLFAPLSANLPATVSCPAFGACCLLSALLTLRLPETVGQKLS